MDIKDTLITLSNAVSLGNINTAVDIIEEELKKYCEVSRNGKTVIGKIDKQSDYTILIDAHSDEVGMTVTDIDNAGFLTAGKCGGIDLRHLSAKPVIIHGKKDVAGVFISTPPHLKDEDSVADDISEIKIDSLLGKEAEKYISIGDFISYSTRAFSIGETEICGKSLDNRAGVTCALCLASRLYDKDLPCNLIFLFSDAEELGLRGAKTAAFDLSPDEALVIDVSFGNGPDISPLHCGNLRSGAMIGVSPCLDRNISDALHIIANDENIIHQSEIMSGSTSTNADVLSLSKSGIRTGLVSIPLRNMHTDTEIVDLSDINSTIDILEKYILSGGIKNV